MYNDSELIWIETCDGGELMGYLSQSDADEDANGEKPWLAVAKKFKQ